MSFPVINQPQSVWGWAWDFCWLVANCNAKRSSSLFCSCVSLINTFLYELSISEQTQQTSTQLFKNSFLKKSRFFCVKSTLNTTSCSHDSVFKLWVFNLFFSSLDILSAEQNSRHNIIRTWTDPETAGSLILHPESFFFSCWELGAILPTVVMTHVYTELSSFYT